MLRNGKITTQTGTQVGSKATYDCNANYVLNMNTSIELTCQLSGNWSDKGVQCGEGGERNV